MPQADPTVRAELEQQAAQRGWPALHAELARVDPVTAVRLAPADSQRISRALEVYRLTGLPLAHFHTTSKIAAGPDKTRATGQITAQHSAASLFISLEPQDRAWLHQRIAQRFDAMLANGFLDEVAALRACGDLHPELPSMRCVGYRQAWDYLDALALQDLKTPAAHPSQNRAKNQAVSPNPFNDLRDKGIAATRQLAKRQITWLRSMPERHVVACDAPDALTQVLKLADSFVKLATFAPETHGGEVMASKPVGAELFR